ncbi:hypothetical protein CQ043_24610 [Paenibacillus sp. MYb63]|nr:hypothetical protein CQ043_24610 [Paenibacillus sp. MYb63]PRA42390.1 hypothetical protein CQ061_29145 [Paenibacillus sp. MYb67]
MIPREEINKEKRPIKRNDQERSLYSQELLLQSEVMVWALSKALTNPSHLNRWIIKEYKL